MGVNDNHCPTHPATTSKGRPMQREDINAPDAPAPVGQYSQAVEVSGVSRTLYLSGQVGVDADGRVPADIATQTEIAWRNLTAQLRAAGMGAANLVKVTTYIADSADVVTVRAVRAKFLGAHSPASTIVVAGLVDPAWKVEIEGIAVA